jgi:predicted nucleic acid-binding protein
MANPPRAFLDANVIRGQLTNDVLLTLAHDRLFSPRWSEQVLDEAKRNRPENVSEAKIDSRFAQMNRVFSAAMTTGYEGLMPEMQADEKDKHVLAAAVHSKSTVLVTENTKDFNPPPSGPNAMKVERASAFLNRLLEENPDRVKAALNKMLARNRSEPQTMPQLIDKMASQTELKGFAHKLNEAVPEKDRGTHPSLQTSRSMKAAMEGMAPAQGAAEKPVTTPEARKSVQGPEAGTEKEM